MAVSEIAAIASAASLLDRLVHNATATPATSANATTHNATPSNGISHGAVANAPLPQIITQFGVVDDAVQVAIMRAAAAPRRDGRAQGEARDIKSAWLHEEFLGFGTGLRSTPINSVNDHDTSPPDPNTSDPFMIIKHASLSSRRYLCDQLLPIFHATPEVNGRVDDPATRELSTQLATLSRICSEDRLWQEFVKRRHRLLGFKDFTIGPGYVNRDLHQLGTAIIRALQCDGYFLRRFFGFGNPTIITANGSTAQSHTNHFNNHPSTTVNTHIHHTTAGGMTVMSAATTTTTTTTASSGAAMGSTTIGPMLLSSPSVSPSPLFGRMIQLYMSHYERVCVTVLADIGATPVPLLVGWKDFTDRLHHYRTNGIPVMSPNPLPPRTIIVGKDKKGGFAAKNNQVVPIMITTDDTKNGARPVSAQPSPSSPSRPLSRGGAGNNNSSAPVTEVVDDGTVMEQQALASGLIGVVDLFLTRFHQLAIELVTPQDIPFLTLAQLLKDGKHHIITGAELLINQTLAASAKLDDDHNGGYDGMSAQIGGTAGNADFPSITIDALCSGSSGAQATLTLIRDDERSIKIAQSCAVICHAIQSLYPLLAVGLRDVNDTLQRRLRAGLTRYLSFITAKAKRSPVDAPLSHLYLCLASVAYLRASLAAVDASLNIASTRRQSWNTARRSAQQAAAAAAAVTTANNTNNTSDTKYSSDSKLETNHDSKDGTPTVTTAAVTVAPERKLVASLAEAKDQQQSGWMAVSRDAERITAELVDRVVTVLCEQAKTSIISGIYEGIDWAKQRDLPESLHPKITCASHFVVMWDLFIRGAMADISASCPPVIMRTILARVTHQSAMMVKQHYEAVSPSRFHFRQYRVDLCSMIALLRSCVQYLTVIDHPLPATAPLMLTAAAAAGASSNNGTLTPLRPSTASTNRPPATPAPAPAPVTGTGTTTSGGGGQHKMIPSLASSTALSSPSIGDAIIATNRICASLAALMIISLASPDDVTHILSQPSLSPSISVAQSMTKEQWRERWMPLTTSTFAPWNSPTLLLTSPFNPIIEFRKLAGRGDDGTHKDTTGHGPARDEYGRQARLLTVNELLSLKCDWNHLIHTLVPHVLTTEEIHLFVSKRGDLRIGDWPELSADETRRANDLRTHLTTFESRYLPPKPSSPVPPPTAAIATATATAGIAAAASTASGGDATPTPPPASTTTMNSASTSTTPPTIVPL